MKNKKTIVEYILITFLFLGNFSAFSQTIHKHLRYGDEHYYNEEYQESEEAYRKALQKDTNSVNANYNLGNVLYQQERFNEAANYYAEAVENAQTNEQKANAYHNLGNANLAQLEGLNPQQQQKALNQSVEAYKNALKINPDDRATKYNLAYAQRLMQQMQQNPPPQSGEGEQEQKQQPEQQQQKPQDNEGEQEQPEQKKEEEKKQQPKPKSGEMTKEEAERLLKIMEEEERKVQNRMNKEKAKATPKSKDW